jgi:hypothetical protein
MLKDQDFVDQEFYSNARVLGFPATTLKELYCIYLHGSD